MKIVFGLGNPGKEYAGTRHNVGFTALDTFAAENNAKFKEKSKFNAFVAEFSIQDEKVLLVKPQTFYNSVGESYQAVIHFYKTMPTDVLVIHDELALPFGTVRIREGGSDAGNNGIKSINEHGGEKTARLRVGVANEQRSIMGDTDFVLGRFSHDEQAVHEKNVLPKIVEIIAEFIQSSHAVTSHTLV